ncbi:hypothetical protein [Streptomyces sp. NPDC051561]|uniref:hypothetical protein n=1 Tax=Streptomyces sp. NPDC051561 TaxID=3365658 RepID=UPI00379D3639
MKRRTLGLVGAGAAAVLAMGLTAAPAQAHSTDDWITTGDWAHVPGNRDANLNWGGVAKGKVMINWDGTYVEVKGEITDTKVDGLCAIAQIRYEVKTNGAWAGHWHYRSTVVDCSNGNGAASPISKGRYPTRNLSARACVGDAKGATTRCEGTWH